MQKCIPDCNIRVEYRYKISMKGCFVLVDAIHLHPQFVSLVMTFYCVE